MLRTSALGATPVGASDCLNYGNPQKPEIMWQIVEGIELQGHRFGVGVQWHPERGTDNRLFDAFIEAAR